MKAHLADERCLNNEPDEHDPASLVDCESELCSKDPNVTICPLESQKHGGGLGVRTPLSDELLDDLSEYIQENLTKVLRLPDAPLFAFPKAVTIGAQKVTPGAKDQC